MTTSYTFHWKDEITWALITFAVYVGGQFLLTDTTPITDWQGWAIGTSLAGARVVVAGLVRSLAGLIKKDG